MFGRRKRFNARVDEILTATSKIDKSHPGFPGILAYFSLIDQKYHEGWEAERTGCWIALNFCTGMIVNGSEHDKEFAIHVLFPNFKDGARALLLTGKLEESSFLNSVKYIEEKIQTAKNRHQGLRAKVVAAPNVIKVGDKIPAVILRSMAKDGIKNLTTDDIFKGKNVAFFGVPGAFTPTCSTKHLPSFIQKCDDLKAKGVDTVACISVNDAFVMDAWGKAQGATGKVLMLADGNAEFAKALGIEMDGTLYGLGTRLRRFSAYAEDGEVKTFNLEKPGAFEVSSAGSLVEQIVQNTGTQAPSRGRVQERSGSDYTETTQNDLTVDNASLVGNAVYSLLQKYSDPRKITGKDIEDSAGQGWVFSDAVIAAIGKEIDLAKKEYSERVQSTDSASAKLEAARHGGATSLIRCQNCSVLLRLPKNRQGVVVCPECGNRANVKS